jgi:hypothetical protein
MRTPEELARMRLWVENLRGVAMTDGLPVLTEQTILGLRQMGDKAVENFLRTVKLPLDNDQL